MGKLYKESLSDSDTFGSGFSASLYVIRFVRSLNWQFSSGLQVSFQVSIFLFSLSPFPELSVFASPQAQISTVLNLAWKFPSEPCSFQPVLPASTVA